MCSTIGVNTNVIITKGRFSGYHGKIVKIIHVNIIDPPITGYFIHLVNFRGMEEVTLLYDGDFEIIEEDV